MSQHLYSNPLDALCSDDGGYATTTKAVPCTAAPIAVQHTPSSKAVRSSPVNGTSPNSAHVAFCGTLGHELRTPVATIQAGIELLQNTSLNSTQARHLRLIQHASQMLAQNLDELLNYSHLQLGEPQVHKQPFQPNALVNEVVTINSIHAEAKALIVAIDIAADVPTWVNGDKEKISRVLQNLLSNAIKFSEYGSIHIAIEVLHTSVSTQQTTLRFSVLDNGIGIDHSELETIRQPFVQGYAGRTLQQGTGLGLAICERIIDLLEGRLHIHSQRDEGCHVYFDLPFELSEAPAAHPDTALSTIQALQLLIVDDDDAARFVAEHYTTRLGHHCFLASSTAEAAAILAEHPIDALLLDIHLGHESGLELAQWLRNTTAYATLPIVFLSARHDIDELLGSAHISHSTFLSKPLQQNTLYRALQQLTASTPSTQNLVNTQHLENETRKLGVAYVDELILLYLQQCELSEQQLHTALEHHAVEECLPTLHRLKGSCSAVGLHTLVNQCAKAEYACLHNHVHWSTHIQQLVQLLATSRLQLQQYTHGKSKR